MICSLLILSSDGYSDCWEVFFGQLKEHWQDCYFRTYLVTEKKKCSYCETINIDNPSWSFRFKEALKQLDTRYVLIMLEDYFIRAKVDQDRIDETFDLFDSKTITFDFEKEYATTLPTDKVGWGLKPNKAIYLNCTQAGIWNRELLIDRLDEDSHPQKWETTNIDSPYNHYVNKADYIIDYGYRQQRTGWGVVRGQWSPECVEWLKTTKYKVNIEERGIFDGKLY